MATLANLVVKLLLDSSDYLTGLDKGASKLSSVGSSMVSAGQKLTLGITTPLIAASGAAIKLAVDAEETASKFNTVLGPAAAAFNDRITEMQRTIPATRQQLQNAIADFSALAQATGIAGDKANELGADFTTAAADLASFNNSSPEEAILAIRSALVGSSEPLLAYGVDTRQAALEAKALAMGLIEAGQTMDAATRATVLLAQIHDDAAHAMGDAARTADSTANSMKFLKADVIDLATEIGQQLVPIVRPMIQAFSEWLTKLKEMEPGTRTLILVILGIAAAIGPVLIVLGTLFSAVGALIPVFAAVSAPVLIVIGVIAALGAALVLLWKNSETFRDTVTAAFEAVRRVAIDVFEGLRDFFGEIAGELYETIDVRFIQPFKLLWAKWGDEITTVAKVAWETLSTVIGTQLKVVWEVISTALGIIKDGILLVLNLIQGDWSGAWENIKSIASTAGDGLKGILTAIWDGIKGLWDIATADLALSWTGAWEEIKGIPERAQAGLESILSAIWDGIKTIFATGIGGVVGFVNGLFGDVARILGSMKETAITIVKSMWEDIKGVFTGAIQGVRDKMGEVEETVTGGFRRIWDEVVGHSIWPEMWEEIEGVVTTASSTIDGLMNDWKGTLMGIFDDISGGLIGKVTSLWNDITHIFDGGISDIVNRVGRIVQTVSDVVNQGISLLGKLTGAASTAATAVTTATTAVGAATTVAGVAGTAGGLTTGVGIPTIGAGGGAAGGVGTATSILGGAAGAGLALGAPLAIAFGGEWLMNKLGGESIQESFLDNYEQQMAAIRAKDAFQAAIDSEHIMTGGGTFVPSGGFQQRYNDPSRKIVIEVPLNIDGREVTRVVTERMAAAI